MFSTSSNDLPVAVLGAGPVGLAAAAHLSERGLPFVIFEAGDSVGASIKRWGHVRLFSPWRTNLDRAAQRLLKAHGWSSPAPGGYPTGADIVEQYLTPLVQADAIAPHVRLNHNVIGVTRQGVDKLRDDDREDRPFIVTTSDPAGITRTPVRAVIDATGTWLSPNPIGAEGIPAIGEEEAHHWISYGIPDVLGAERDRYAGRRVAVVGSGHSAKHAVRELALLAEQDPATTVTWIVRRGEDQRVYGNEVDARLPERGKLGADAHNLVSSGRVRLETGFRTERIHVDELGITLVSPEGQASGPFDEIIAATGLRPDFSFLREVRVDLDPWVESTRALAPLIDPNVHSCGSVPPHGAAELAHPEQGFYAIGAKSYGRAPNLLLATGYEQARSVVAQLAGDHEAAARVELVLPASGSSSGSSCGLKPPPEPAAPQPEPVTSACCG
ncbi:NAD(P)-binding domain-containing protein [Mycobacterium sp. ITM-2016-00318]|uniref:NAD(P)-binding domain-containing protein n=1 Tax=Mycobacterium sp. ITM-2016-00318 TaxID=2099693 RepID=UPI000CF927CE|nr:NAD(P)-binding domain-containing protein [Mycobacterium sp. ITM-2016-00318]WNG90642.1 NAD(P)-binding domain-containing protein [Mycobacterium sp. ITM-2016-00318]